MKKYFLNTLILAILILISSCLSMSPKKDQPFSTLIRLNSIGFLPDYEKQASIAQECSSFKIINAVNDKTEYTGNITGPVKSSDTEEQIYIADFSSFTKSGSYYLFVPKIGKSIHFTIKNDIYNKVFDILMLGMYLWRCSTEVSAEYNGTLFSHASAHTKDGYMDFITGDANSKKDGNGGWYDAGDYGKYVVNAGITTGMMFKAWEFYQDKIKKRVLMLPEQGGTLPDYLDELKWEMDWILKMQYPDGSGRVSHKLTAKNFWAFLLPEFDTNKRYFAPWSSAATADFVGMLAMASRIYKPYNAAFAEKCLDAARLSYDFLKKNPENHAADLNHFNTGGYQTTDPDDRLWAAAEMWETTGEKDYLLDFEKQIRNFNSTVVTSFDWTEVRNLGVFTYLMSDKKGKDDNTVKIIKKDLASAADRIVKTSDQNAYARPLGKIYYWGCNGAVARQTLVLAAANMISEKREYTDTMLDAIGHLLGRNYYCRSYITGLGFSPPKFPHDRRSGGDKIKDPWPGYLVGGGHTATDWVDKQEDYSRNEIAINWNGALIFAVAAFLE